MHRAIIAGSSGQDGALLYKLLEKENYELIGLDMGCIRTNQSNCSPDSLNICDSKAVESLVKLYKPDEVYHLAAFHHSAEDREFESGKLWEQSYNVNTASLHNFLEAIRLYSPNTRLFYAASSHVFGTPLNDLQDESTPINPISFYGITKATGLFLCRSYRKSYGTYAAVGILYNHESIYRSEKFISAKIIHSALRIKMAEQKQLVIGDLNAVADWGYAPDYVNAMKKILELTKPDDFVIATGEKHTVREFIEIVFKELGLVWEDFVEERRDVLMRQSSILLGNSNKLRAKTGWKPTVTFESMVRSLVSQYSANYEVEKQ
jgi:GDPmannose 4,6-dehydratase